MPAEAGPEVRGFITPEDYLESERRSEERHDYLNGRIVVVEGACVEHEIVAGNLAAAVHMHLKGKPCQAFKSGMKLRIRTMGNDLFYYPDVMVTCDPADTHRYYREKPKLVIEVLSEDTNKDLVEKFFAYKTIPSLEEYVIVNPNPAAREVRILRRSSGWEPAEICRDGEFILESVGLTLKVSDLYAS